MELHKQGPKDILQKHIDLNPKFSLVISLTDQAQITLDISHPMEMSDLTMIYMFLKRHVENVVDRSMTPVKITESTL